MVLLWIGFALTEQLFLIIHKLELYQIQNVIVYIVWLMLDRAATVDLRCFHLNGYQTVCMGELIVSPQRMMAKLFNLQDPTVAQGTALPVLGHLMALEMASKLSFMAQSNL